MQRISDVGEFGLIERIARRVAREPAPRVIIGPGDDGAVVRPPAGHDLVVSTDSLVEDVHFRWATQTAVAIGRRAMVANLSDLAAMGAAPLGCVAALAAPPDLSLRRAEDLVVGLLREGRTHGCPLVGGNLASARETQLTLTVFGHLPRGTALRRHALRVDDRVFVTGVLGASALALARAERLGKPIRHRSVPRLAAGRALRKLRCVGACIDVSDGLSGDLGHLLERSDLGIEIDASKVPRPRRLEAECRRLGIDASALVLRGGEDYELLFTLRRRGSQPLSASVLSRRLGCAVHEIGRVTRAPGLRGLPEGTGWQHF